MPLTLVANVEPTEDITNPLDVRRDPRPPPPDRRPDKPHLLTLEQTAARLSTTPRFVRRLVTERRLSYTKTGKFVTFDRAD
jgi:excisionase family DNA binding protein